MRCRCARPGSRRRGLRRDRGPRGRCSSPPIPDCGAIARTAGGARSPPTSTARGVSRQRSWALGAGKMPPAANSAASATSSSRSVGEEAGVLKERRHHRSARGERQAPARIGRRQELVGGSAPLEASSGRGARGGSLTGDDGDESFVAPLPAQPLAERVLSSPRRASIAERAPGAEMDLGGVAPPGPRRRRTSDSARRRCCGSGRPRSCRGARPPPSRRRRARSRCPGPGGGAHRRGEASRASRSNRGSLPANRKDRRDGAGGRGMWSGSSPGNRPRSARAARRGAARTCVVLKLPWVVKRSPGVRVAAARTPESASGKSGGGEEVTRSSWESASGFQEPKVPAA